MLRMNLVYYTLGTWKVRWKPSSLPCETCDPLDTRFTRSLTEGLLNTIYNLEKSNYRGMEGSLKAMPHLVIGGVMKWLVLIPILFISCASQNPTMLADARLIADQREKLEEQRCTIEAMELKQKEVAQELTNAALEVSVALNESVEIRLLFAEIKRFVDTILDIVERMDDTKG